jgi:signal peptidase II
MFVFFVLLPGAILVGIAVIIAFLLSTPARKVHVQAALGMLAGGALGNMVDRIGFGIVRDFIDLHWGDVLHWYTFNVADAAICVGFALMACDLLFAGEAAADGERAADVRPRGEGAGR